MLPPDRRRSVPSTFGLRGSRSEGHDLTLVSLAGAWLLSPLPILQAEAIVRRSNAAPLLTAILLSACVSNTAPETVMPDTPAGAVERFLRAWHSQDWSAMAAATQTTWRSGETNAAGWLANAYGSERLVEWQVEGTKRKGQATVDVTVRCRTDVSAWFRLRARVIRESGAYRPDPHGRWGVNPLSTLRRY